MLVILNLKQSSAFPIYFKVVSAVLFYFLLSFISVVWTAIYTNKYAR